MAASPARIQSPINRHTRLSVVISFRQTHVRRRHESTSTVGLHVNDPDSLITFESDARDYPDVADTDL
uniref:Uncharacterized protein n=1 Tax=Panagrellus redivivus TaxID=6233 RepID=A0A7E4VX74_PANRE